MALIAIKAGKSRAQPPGLDANDRIGARIEGGFLAEDLDADHIFLELAAAAADGLPDDKADEALRRSTCEKVLLPRMRVSCWRTTLSDSLSGGSVGVRVAIGQS